MGLSPRALNALYSAGIKTIKELERVSDEDLKKSKALVRDAL